MKRRTFKLCVFVLLGAIVNVAVAWGCASLEVYKGSEIFVPPNKTQCNWWIRHRPDTTAGDPSAVQQLLYFGTAYERYGNGLSPMLMAARLRAGWPVLGLEGRVWWRDGGDRIREEGWNQFSNGIFPSWPIWPGFAINTVFYAAMLWLLLFGPGKIRRFIRARRGQCPACAYPIGTSEVCTECGSPVRHVRPAS